MSAIDRYMDLGDQEMERRITAERQRFEAEEVVIELYEAVHQFLKNSRSSHNPLLRGPLKNSALVYSEIRLRREG